MPRKVTTAQPKFKILVANLDGSGDPSRGINPVKVRSVYEQQHLPEVPKRGNERGPGVEADKTPGLRTRHFTLLRNPTTGAPIASTGTVEVINNDFTVPTTLYLGNYTLTSGEDYAVAGGVAGTAANLAGAINALPEFNATVLGATVSITGPVGPDGRDILFEAIYGAAIQNFTLVPSDGTLASSEPVLGPVNIS